MTSDPLTLARARAKAPDFTQVFTGPVPGPSDGPLDGLTVAVKDLFDVQGYQTRAGSKARDTRPLAAKDALAVARMRAAGAGLVGHTNMTEFAYSGLGQNPHYGTPLTPLIAGAIAGGSTSGGASAVARGVADIALGTDTGGSLRIPAAFCGIIGFKPTADDVPRDGAVALSHTLDSVGVMARDALTLHAAMEVLRDAPYDEAELPQELILPRSFGRDALDPQVAEAFEDAREVLTEAGYRIIEMDLPFLDLYRQLEIWHFSAVESRLHHASEYAEHHDRIDSRVTKRMARADEVTAPDYARSLLLRETIARSAKRELLGRAIVLPTTPILPPQLSALEDEEAFNRLNQLALHNTSLANVIDGCAISLPLPHAGVGLMLVAARHEDAKLIHAAHKLAPLLAACAVPKEGTIDKSYQN
ncbi:amidase family protein [Thioclava sp. GXIMD4215]|uniref:amidase family protein n=1 Tax=Thioclava sp. GXIMD4215 TaxID=3131928 RepID=UPI00324B0410